MNEQNFQSSATGNKPKKKSKAKIIIIIIACILVLGILGTVIEQIVNNQNPESTINTIPGDSITDDTILSKTVMIYADGADLEEKHSSSTEAIRQTFNSNVDLDAVNVLVYTGGSNKWNAYDIPADKDCIYLLRNGQLNLLAEYDVKNMGEGATLETFIKYCVTNYPAQQYGLILQDHGGGPYHGVCFDNRNSNDSLNMRELQNAFSAAGFGGSSKMEFVIFDACLMASIETANCISDYANYMIASENVSYTYGSDYSFMEALNKYNSGADIGKAYVDCFYKESIALANQLIADGKSVYDITYSCLDLSKVGKVKEELNAFFANVNEDDLFASGYVNLCAYNARGVMENVDEYSSTTGVMYDLIDLKDWISFLDTYYPDEVMRVNAAIDELVVYNKASTSKMNGVTIYFPKHITGNYWYDNVGFSDEYTKYVKTCYDESASPENLKVWNTISALSQEVVETPELSGLSMQLTDAQKANFASAEYYILAKYNNLEEYKFEKNQYSLVSCGNDVTFVKDNVLMACYDNRIPYVVKPDGTKVPVSSTLYRNKTADGDIFYNMYSGLINIPDVEDYPGTEDDPEGLNALAWSIDNMRMDVAKLTFSVVGDDMSVVFAEKINNDSENVFPSRVMLDVNDYQEIEFFSNFTTVAYDDNGKPLPANAWQQNSDSMMNSSYKLEEIDFQMGNMNAAQDYDVDYYGMLVITDIFGNQYCTDIVPLDK